MILEKPSGICDPELMTLKEIQYFSGIDSWYTRWHIVFEDMNGKSHIFEAFQEYYNNVDSRKRGEWITKLDE